MHAVRFQKRTMSSRSRLAVALAGLFVISGLFFSTSWVATRNALSNETGTLLNTRRLDTPLNVSGVTLQHVGQNPEMPRPVKKFPYHPKSIEIQLFKFEFERPYLGHEGPNFTQLDGEPSAGAEYLATAQLFREEAVSTARFELIDQQGRTIQLLHFYKRDNSLEFAEFFGSAKIPEQPFRVAVSGIGIDGEQYRRVFDRLFRPTRLAPAPPILPRKLSPREARKIADMLKQMETQALARLAERARKDPEGIIVMPRIEISNVTHQSFASDRGNKLGMLLSYDMSFATDGDYAHSLQVFPFYEDDDMRGLIDMEVLSEEINPKPEPPSYATPQIYVDLKTLVRYGSEAWYKRGVVYHFTVKLVPNFVGENKDRTKFCVDEERFKTNPNSLQRWQKIKHDQGPIAYRIFMYPLAWGGETEPSDPPKIYYDGFLKEGAVKCLPNKNYNF